MGANCAILVQRPGGIVTGRRAVAAIGAGTKPA